MEKDIAVVDIHDVVNFLAAELTPAELRQAVNKAFVYISDRTLCGKPDVKRIYQRVVSDWLDTVEGPD